MEGRAARERQASPGQAITDGGSSTGKRGLHIEIRGKDHTPEGITPYPYTFFYWGVQWEIEQGRPVDRAVKRIVG